jgi:hypothetical protein
LPGITRPMGESSSALPLRRGLQHQTNKETVAITQEYNLP